MSSKELTMYLEKELDQLKKGVIQYDRHTRK